MAENIKSIQKEISIQTVKMNKAINKLAEKFDKLTISFEMIAENTVLKDYQNIILDFDEIRRLPNVEEKTDTLQVEKLNIEEYFYDLIRQFENSSSKICKSIEKSIQQLIQNFEKSFQNVVKIIRDSANRISYLIKNEITKLIGGISELFNSAKKNFDWKGNLKDSLTCNCAGNTQKNESEKTNPLAEIGKWLLSNILEEIVSDKFKKLLEPVLGTKPITTTLLAGVQALFGNKAAQSALVFMIDPLLKKVAPLLKYVVPFSKVTLPLLAAVGGLKVGFDLGKETEELLQNINKLGEEEGRKASGNGIMDKVALYQYDTEQANVKIQQVQVDLPQKFASVISKWWEEEVSPWFTVEKWQELGENIKKGLTTKWEEFTTWWEDTGIYEWWTEDVSPWFTKEKWQELGENVKKGLTTKWEEFTTWWEDIGVYNWWTEDVSPWFTIEKWQELGKNIKTGLITKWEEFTTWWEDTGIYEWWTEDVLPWFTAEKWQSLANGILQGITNKWNEVKDWWNKKDSLSKIEVSFSDFVQSVKMAYDQLVEWWEQNKPSLDKIKLGIDIPQIEISYNPEGKSAKLYQFFGFGGTPELNIKYKKYASGGFPEDGWFRASHGEIMGRFDNGQSVVANNIQITNGIANAVYPAVYDAMMSALSQNRNNGNVVVQIDGREVFRTVRKQANNYMRQTGQPAFNY